MAGYSSVGAGAPKFVDSKIKQRKVMLFTKKKDKNCDEIKQLMLTYKLKPEVYEICEIESRQDCTQIENYFQIICQTNARCVPQLFVGKQYMGSTKEIVDHHSSGYLRRMMVVAQAVQNI